METLKVNQVDEKYSDLNRLEKKMVGIIQEGPIKSKDLYYKVNITERAGADTLGKLIDSHIVGVNVDWTLYLK